MSTLYQLIRTEYKTEYVDELAKLKKIMEKKYSVPKIYPKIISEKRLKAFSEREKEEILKKHKR